MAANTLSTEELLEQAAKLAKYRHLLPSVSAAFASKSQNSVSDEPLSSTAPGEAAATSGVVAPETWEPLDDAALRDRAIGCLLGLAVGDALGAAVQGMARDSFSPPTQLSGGGPLNLKPGEWSDETAQALCIAESLLTQREFNQADFMTRLRLWLESGHNTPGGKCVGAGATTRAAVERFAATGEPVQGTGEDDTAGDGSLIRVPPVAIFFASNPDEAVNVAQMQSLCTHATQESVDACRLLAAELVDALSGASAAAALQPRVMNLAPRVLFVCAGEWRDKSRAEIKSSGYVVTSLEAAMWAVGTTNSFTDAVQTAAGLGEHSDSVAALAGALAGAIYGTAGIPTAWLDQLAQHDKIGRIAHALHELGRKQ